ncbi:MAG: histidine phosphatase family protein, partial [Planctomycetota bacterium]
TIALASHRVPIKLLICAALGLSDSAFWQIQIDTASISALDYIDGKFNLIFQNETCHLKSFGDKLGVVDF